MRKCEYCGSEEKVMRFKGEGLYCQKHYNQLYHSGKIRELNGRRKENTFVDKGDFVEIHFKKGQIAFIDKEDFEKVKEYYWGINSQGYLHSRINGRLTRLHLFILNFPSKTIDHINRDKLDNRKTNLRECEQRENCRNLSIKKNNTSGYPGVEFIKKTKKWRAKIMVNRKGIHLGHYNSFEEAKKARMAGEVKYFGEFAPNYKELRKC